ncbi:MAG: hypothetical protein ACXAEF_08645 [Candidatus Thorarchaeota archaeon]
MVTEIILEFVNTVFLYFYAIVILLLVDRLRSHVKNRITPPQNLIESNPINLGLVHEIDVQEE